MIGNSIGRFFAAARNALADGLIGLGVTPNTLTVAGFLVTLGAAVCLALGAGAPFAPTLAVGALSQYAPNAYLALATALLLLCAAGDMLDGAVARRGNAQSAFGAFLDSTLDRFSDFAICAGIACYYLPRGNLTCTLLPFVAFFWGMMVSYTRARAEDLIKFCTVGYWQRPERIAAILIAAAAHNVPAFLWQQATLPALTVWARIRFTFQVTAGQEPLRDVRTSPRRLDRLKLWRYPRGTVPYDVVTGLNILWLIFAPLPSTFDPLRGLLGL